MIMAAWRAISALALASVLLADADDTHGAVKFGYSGSNSPDKWGSLSPDYRMCSKGERQSPINIEKSKLAYNPGLEALERNYVPASATLVNKGYQIGLLFDKNVGTVLVDGKNYSLKSVHWHSPSEHTIDGKRFPVELHMVHMSDNGKIAVVAILYQIGRHDPFVVQIERKLKELAKEAWKGDKEAHIPVRVVHTRSLKLHSSKYYRYFGSLTTPPCTENVIWSILARVRGMTEEQVAALQAPLSQENRNNSRPIQPLNYRAVQLYHESRKHNEDSH
ncbi:alpha carbonic anhydrase 1, chloroplastic isoform X2 [Elaeis guineensis]|uniref:Carbonic anhydrase n=1 Tax=Elaeis guineensis var. tenera TaxID=51953 RepID=A0A6I9QNA2_ELAGV|nr:alpha carbonic anhydrase 1, chloroplastic isoform X2 [Elaeis guineensis]